MTDQPACVIDGFGPLPVLVPGSVAELGEVVRRASAEGRALYPLGGRTMLDYGLPPSREGFAVDLRPLAALIDYPARDMTITVQAGITIRRLQEMLAAENQRLPIDVPHSDRATLGGAIATNVSGPRRYGFGTFRDYVLGLSAVNDDGQEIKAGGRVVKNVAGYDLCKLYTGSLGTLGILTQVTLKLKPRPERSLLVPLQVPAERLDVLLDTLHASRTRPVSISVLNPSAAAAVESALGTRAWGLGKKNGAGGCLSPRPEPPCPSLDWLVLVGFEDNQEAVAWQVRQVQEEVGALGVGLRPPWPDAVAEPIWRTLADFPLVPAAALTFKANLLPSQTAAFCRQAAELPERPQLLAHAGSGIVVGHVFGDLTLERAAAMLKALRDAAIAARGNLILLRCPAPWKATLPVWGTPRGDAWLMRAVKDKLDPRRVFNPGRFVDAI